MRLQLLLFALASVCIAADDPKKDIAAEKAKLQGTWEVVSVELGGKPADNDLFKDATITFSGDKMTFKLPDQKQEGTFRLDPAKKPKEIDLIAPGGDADKKEVDRGIYQLDKGVLKLCMGGTEKTRSFNNGKTTETSKESNRPKAFDSKQGALLVLKRKK